MAFWNGKKKENKHITVSKTDYGKAVLSYIVIQQGKHCEKLLTELERDRDFTEYLSFLQYIVFISQKILETRFSSADATKIAASSFDGIVEYFEFMDNKQKLALAEVLKEQYTSSTAFIDCDIYKKEGLHSLVDAFLEDINVGKDYLYHLTFFTTFSSYIIHHTSSIFNENITIV